jgi:hypothetical protein
MPDPAPILRRLREILSIPGDRVGKARRIAAAIRETGGYRWVGIHEVSPEEEAGVLAWSGPGEPRDTHSRIVIPILGPTAGQVVGLLEVESDAPDAFDEEVRQRLEECAALLRPLWG